MRKAFDISAYLVAGPENTLGRPFTDILEAAVAEGFTCLQIRSKKATARELVELTREAAEVIARQGKSEKVALLVNDRLDVALAAREAGIKVDGIHVGQEDIPVGVCRKYLGEQAIIGLSARRENLVEYIKKEDVSAIDYFGAGPLHETATKPESSRDSHGNVVTRSLKELAELAVCSPRPVVVGGGVKARDLPALAATGVQGFFVVSAVTEAPDPRSAARELVETWKKSK